MGKPTNPILRKIHKDRFWNRQQAEFMAQCIDFARPDVDVESIRFTAKLFLQHMKSSLERIILDSSGDDVGEKPMDPKTKTFASGAKRSADRDHLRFSHIHPLALIAMARVAKEGELKYGAYNWEVGMPIEDTLDHLFGHLTMWMAGDRSEPHLEHALYNMVFLIHTATFFPEMCDCLRGPGCIVTDKIKSRLAEGEAERKRAREDGELDLAGDWTLETVPEVLKILSQRAK